MIRLYIYVKLKLNVSAVVSLLQLVEQLQN